MKKIFTLALALMGFASVGNAETIDDVAVCKHSYVLKFEDHLNNGEKPGKGKIFGDGFFLDVTGGTIGTKGAIDLADENFAGGAYIKYAEYGKPSKTWRLKNGQDVIAMKVTAKSKIIILGESHASRGPKITTAAPSSNTMQGDVLAFSNNTKETGGVFEWVADDDRTIYIGSEGGDYYCSYLIVEANEAPGTPTVKVSDMQYDGALYYKEVTCTANPATEEGSTEQIPTIVTYTTDGSMPTAASPLYTAPIKCTNDMVVKFQAFLDFGDGKADAANICDGADNEGIVSFIFDAPVINNEGGNVTISTGYNNATNYYSYGEVKDAQGDSFTLTEGATVTAYTKIANGDVTFTSKSTSKDIYEGLLAAIKEKKTITVSGSAVVDDEATATSTTGTIYKVDGGAITAESKDFFVKNLTFGAIASADANNAQYQAPDGQEAYIKMSDTNITFLVAADDIVKVKVICSKNSCKTLENEDESKIDRKCYVNISGTTYGNDDVTAENGNIIEFELKGGKTTKQNVKDAEGNDVIGEDGKAVQEEVFTAGDTYYTFQKYSGTGNILISSIEITPAAAAPAAEPWAAPETERAVNKTYDLAGTWAGDWFEPGQNYDASEYDYVWIKYSGYTGKINFGITYMEWESTQSWGEVYHSDAVTLNEAAGIAAVKLEKTKTIVNGINNVESEYKGDIYAKHVKNVFLQDQGTASKITVEGIYFGTEAAYNAAVATGIQGVKTVKAQSSAIYNLAGQRVDANYKGVVIMNGKKVVIK